MQKTQNIQGSGKAPEKRFSTGAITAAVWKNEAVMKDGKKAEFRTITLQRRYKDKDETWKSTNSMRLNDLPRASLVLQKAYEYLVLREDQGTPLSGDSDIIEEDIVM